VPLSQIDNWTLTAWIKLATTNQNGQVVTVGYDNGISSSANGFGFVIAGQQNLGNQLWGVFGGIESFDSEYSLMSSNQWYHVVMLCVSGVTEFFVNGVSTAFTQSGITPRTPTSFTIGSASGVRFFNGSINDVRIYNLALSSAEVSQLYAIESAPPLSIYTAVEVDFLAASGQTYQIQHSGNLSNWINVGSTIIGSNQTVQEFFSTRGTNNQYYVSV
jgi:hypothetical protein